MKFEIRKLSSGEVVYTADLDASLESADYSVQLGAAVKIAVGAGSYLAQAKLAGADLAGAYLVGANLAGADLAGSYLAHANLVGADLAGAYLVGANLAGAYLAGAYLAHANLEAANLETANLVGAILVGARLAGANIKDVNLAGANLRNVRLAGAKNGELAAAMTEILPREGEVIGWKKAGPCLVKLRVPPEAKRSNATGRKCRAEFVEVLEVIGDGAAITTRRGLRTEYIAGETVRPDKWDARSRWHECTHGIHFYLTREEAEAHS